MLSNSPSSQSVQLDQFPSGPSAVLTSIQWFVSDLVGMIEMSTCLIQTFKGGTSLPSLQRNFTALIPLSSMEGWANEAWDFSALWKAQIIVKQKHGQPTANLAFIFLICAPMAWGARLRDWRCAEKKKHQGWGRHKAAWRASCSGTPISKAWNRILKMINWERFRNWEWKDMISMRPKWEWRQKSMDGPFIFSGVITVDTSRREMLPRS